MSDSLLNSGGDAGDAGDTGDTGTNTDSSGGNVQYEGSEAWKNGLDEALLKEESIQKFKSVEELGKSYLNLQKTLGHDKVTIPGKNATEEDYRAVFQKLGLPESYEGYEIPVKEGETVDKEFLENFRKTAYDAGVLPSQSKKLFDWYSQVQSSMSEKMLEAKVNQREMTVKSLTEEWGGEQQFHTEMKYASKLVDEYGGEKVHELLESTGLGANVEFVKFLHKLGKDTFKESSIQGDPVAGKFGFTPAEAQEKFNEMLGDLSHPYHNPDHPSHVDAMAIAEKLQKTLALAN